MSLQTSLQSTRTITINKQSRWNENWYTKTCNNYFIQCMCSHLAEVHKMIVHTHRSPCWHMLSIHAHYRSTSVSSEHVQCLLIMTIGEAGFAGRTTGLLFSLILCHDVPALYKIMWTTHRYYSFPSTQVAMVHHHLGLLVAKSLTRNTCQSCNEVIFLPQTHFPARHNIQCSQFWCQQNNHSQNMLATTTHQLTRPPYKMGS